MVRGAYPVLLLGRISSPMESSTSPLSVGDHMVAKTRSAALVPLPGHRGTTASPRSLAMLCVRRVVVASAEGVESSASNSACTPLGGHPIGERKSRCVGRQQAPLSWPTVLLAMVAPSCGPLRASALPEVSSHGLAREKNSFEIFCPDY